MITLLYSRIIQYGVNGVYLAVLLCHLDSLHRASTLDRIKNGCSDLCPCLAVCRFV